MIEVRIGDSTRDISNADPGWINEQINRRNAVGVSVCIQVVFNTGTLNFGLSTSTCSRTGGGVSRPFNTQESEIINLWDKAHLNSNDFTSGNLVAFIKQLKHFL